MRPVGPRPISVLLVDPALFTAPYDAGLDGGLRAAGVRTRWAVRPLRTGESPELAPERASPLYYVGVQETAKGRGVVWKLRKAASHLLGGLRLLRLAQREAFDVVHVQWAVLPLVDAALMRRLRRRRPVVLTVHDLQPFNGSPTSRLQTLGFAQVLGAASRIIVHTQAARAVLTGQGLDPARIETIPHGPLQLSVPPAPRRPKSRGAAWRVVLFGKLQPYKGADVLVEALGRLPPAERSRLSVVIAGEPLIPAGPLLARAAELGLDPILEFRLRRLDEAEMAALFDEADAFVFPYRHIEASGVLHLVQPYARWIVASDVGAFRDQIEPGRNGARTPPGDPDALAAALVDSIGRTPEPGGEGAMDWEEIGRRTRAVYEDALAARDRPKL